MAMTRVACALIFVVARFALAGAAEAQRFWPFDALMQTDQTATQSKSKRRGAFLGRGGSAHSEHRRQHRGTQRKLPQWQKEAQELAALRAENARLEEMSKRLEGGGKPEEETVQKVEAIESKPSSAIEDPVSFAETHEGGKVISVNLAAELQTSAVVSSPEKKAASVAQWQANVDGKDTDEDDTNDDGLVVDVGLNSELQLDAKTTKRVTKKRAGKEKWPLESSSGYPENAQDFKNILDHLTGQGEQDQATLTEAKSEAKALQEEVQHERENRKAFEAALKGAEQQRQASHLKASEDVEAGVVSIKLDSELQTGVKETHTAK